MNSTLNKIFFVVWQDPTTRAWRPVARLVFDGKNYRFRYTRGARKSNKFVPFGAMKKLENEYVSPELFPFFKNRLLNSSRSEYADYARWLGLELGELNPLEELSRTAGQRQTDSIFVYPCPSPNAEGKFEMHFFVHGLRYLFDSHHPRIEKLRDGERLFPLLDVQNVADAHAVALRTDEPPVFCGYAPRFVAYDLASLLRNSGEESNLCISVSRYNADAPLQFRILCKVIADWPLKFSPCSDDDFLPLTVDPVRSIDSRRNYDVGLA